MTLGNMPLMTSRPNFASNVLVAIAIAIAIAIDTP